MAILSRPNDSTAGFKLRLSAALVDEGVPGRALAAAYGGPQRPELWVVGGASLFDDASFFDSTPRGTAIAAHPALERTHSGEPSANDGTEPVPPSMPDRAGISRNVPVTVPSAFHPFGGTGTESPVTTGAPAILASETPDPSRTNPPRRAALHPLSSAMTAYTALR